jgi:hypothetical protein
MSSIIKLETVLQIDPRKLFRIYVGALSCYLPTSFLGRPWLPWSTTLRRMDLSRYQAYQICVQPLIWGYHYWRHLPANSRRKSCTKWQGSYPAALISDVDDQTVVEDFHTCMEELGSCFIMFAYHGPKDESDPEAVMFRVHINLQVTRSRSSED